MRTIKLDPQMPERLQMKEMNACGRLYRRLIPHLCAVAERAYLDSYGTGGPEPTGPCGLLVPDAADTEPGMRVAADASSGTNVPGGRRVLSGTVTIGPLDPRDPAFGMDAEQVARFIGRELARSVRARMAVMPTGALKRRSEVLVFGELPLGSLAGDRPLIAECPLLKGRIEVIATLDV